MTLFSSAMAGLVALGVLTGGLAEMQMPEDGPDRRYGWTTDRLITAEGVTPKTKGRHDGSGDFLLREELLPNSSPNDSSQTLYRRTKSANSTESLVKIADGVDGAKLHPSGKLFFVQRGTLFSLTGDAQERLADRSTGDFSLDRHRKRLAMVRLGTSGDPSQLDLLNEDGSLLRTVEDAGEAMVWAPLFTPDGKALIFLSSKTGMASFWRVELDGSGVRQLTNRGLNSNNGGVFSQDFVPPLGNPEKAAFISTSILQYEADEGVIWQLNVESGRAKKIPSAKNETSEGGQP